MISITRALLLSGIIALAFAHTGCREKSGATTSASTNGVTQAIAAKGSNDTTGYDALVAHARALLKDNKLDEAAANASEAALLDNKRYEAHAVLALTAIRAGDGPVAKTALARALERAPVDKKVSLEALQKKVAAIDPSSPSNDLVSVTNIPSAPPPPTAETRRKLEVLALVAEDADKARTPEERHKLLMEYLDKSEDLTNQIPVWTLRAAIGLELNRPKIAWAAGRQLTALGADNGDNPGVRKVLAQLERKGWLGEMPPAPEPEKRDWENSLGMKFKPVTGTEVLFCIWETRVWDFAAFVKETGHNAMDEMYSADGTGSYAQRGHNWKEPGFKQTDNSPVLGVSWEDAQAFCRWLSRKENRTYRLPTELEWRRAMGLPDLRNSTIQDVTESGYPWGTQWPPPSGAGNYAGEEAFDPKDSKSVFPTTIRGYRDDFVRIAPVGSFSENRFGLFDLSGNVAEWTRDLDANGYCISLGGSWASAGRNVVALDGRAAVAGTNARYDTQGFRCVLESQSP